MYRSATLKPQFGINVDPGRNGIQRALELATLADENALDLVGIQDHPYNSGFLDTWTLLTFLASRTHTVRFIPNVVNLPLRPPTILAKAAASLDILTNGRVELGIGAGGFWDGIVAYGGPRRTASEAVNAVEEAIQIMHLLWGRQGSGQPISFSGHYYALENAHPGPLPIHTIGIWLGALKPRMLRLTGRLADGLSISHNWITPDKVPDVQRTIDEAAQEAGRDLNAIRRMYNLMGIIVQSERHVRAKPGYIAGSAIEWAETIVYFYKELAMDTFTFWPIGGNEHEQARLFIYHVIPRVKELLQV